MSHWYDSTRKNPRGKRVSNPGSSATEADALTTRPARRSSRWKDIFRNTISLVSRMLFTLLLLRSPALSLLFSILVTFAYVTVFNPTIVVVTFRLRGWCILSVFLLPAFTRLGHERQDFFLVHAMERMCAQTRPWSISHPKEFWGSGVRTHVTSKGKSTLRGKNSAQRRIEPTALHQAGQRAQHTTDELFRPPNGRVKI